MQELPHFPFPTFIINLNDRKDRREHITSQFAGREEFDINIVDAHAHQIGAIGLWSTICEIIRQASKLNYEYVIICEDDHQFTKHYTRNLLFGTIVDMIAQDADVLCGGVSWFEDTLQISETLCWTKTFTGAQFIVIYKRLFSAILSADFCDSDAADIKLNSLSEKTFFFYPFISVQKDFGYSDVTQANNFPGAVDKLFTSCEKNLKILSQVTNFYNNNVINLPFEINEFSEIVIPTFIINLEERIERREHSTEQFQNKCEFDVRLFPAHKHKIGALGLWNSIRDIVKVAMLSDDDVIIICEDDHEFTNNYSKNYLIKNIVEANHQGAELLIGGIGGFGAAIPVAKNRFWIDSFLSTQFLVIYRDLFSKILDASFDETVTADGILSDLAHNKMAIFPFVSIQREFGYSDVTTWNNGFGNVTSWFVKAAERLNSIQAAQAAFSGRS